MSRISKNFLRDEFACKCGCGFDTVDVKLIEALEIVREHFNAPVKITSGCRCIPHNKSVGGSIKSFHITGRAADFKVLGVSAEKVYEFLSDQYPYVFGIGLYPTWVHFDSRDGVWRGHERKT